MQFKTKKGLGLYWMIPGALFLFHPQVGGVDVLPDFVGYLFLCAAISQVADLNVRISEALSRLKIMVWISVGAFLAQYYLHSDILRSGGEMNVYETPVLLLLYTFVMALLQCYFLIPAYRDLFLGFSALAQRTNSEKLLVIKRGKNRFERLSSYSAVFVVLSSWLSCLPEASVLTSFEYEVEKMNFDWYRFVGLFRTVAVLILLPFAILWLVRIIRLALAMLGDRVWNERLEVFYREEVFCKVGMLSLRRIRFASVFLAVGALFSVHLRMDDRLLIPNLFCSVFLLAGVLLLEDFCKRRKAFFIACGVNAVVSLGQMYLTEAYLYRFTEPEASLYSPDAYRLLCGVQLLQIAEAICSFLLLYLLLRLLYGLICRETAVIYGGEDTEEVSKRATLRLHKKMKQRILIVFFAFFVSFAIGCADSALQVTYPHLWWIALLASLLSVGVFCSLLFSLIEQMEMQYSSTSLNKTPNFAHTEPVIPNYKQRSAQDMQNNQNQNQNNQNNRNQNQNYQNQNNQNQNNQNNQNQNNQNQNNQNNQNRNSQNNNQNNNRCK